MAANRECGCHLSASKSISALVRGCSLQKTWFPQSLASEGVTRTWNNLSVSGQGSNAATCRTCRVSLRRSELAVSSRSGSRCLQTFLIPFNQALAAGSASMEARLLSNARWSRGNVCFSCFGSYMRREFHFNVQLFSINEMDIRAVEVYLLECSVEVLS